MKVFIISGILSKKFKTLTSGVTFLDVIYALFMWISSKVLFYNGYKSYSIISSG
jgi:hypothetical protein